MSSEPEVILNQAENRFELHIDGHIAYEVFECFPGGIAYLHTIVPKELEGHDVASCLMRHILDYARREGLKVRPDCPFVRSYIGKYSEYQGYSLHHGANTHGRSSCFPWRFYQASSAAAIGCWLADDLLVLYGLLHFGQNMSMHIVVLGLLLSAAAFGSWRLWLMARLQHDCSAIKGWHSWLYSECLLSVMALLAALLVLSALVSRLFFENLPLMD